MRKIITTVAVAVFALCGAGLIVAMATAGPDATPAAAEAPAATTAPGTVATANVPAPATKALTVAQRNAARAAENYIDLTGFSRTGLIRQLKYTGYSAADAAVAVDSLQIDWNAQAARKAASYIEMTSFSRASMISQLVYDGFTKAQATHGAKSVGL